MISRRSALQNAIKKFQTVEITSAVRDAQYLLSHTLNLEPAQLVIDLDFDLSADQEQLFDLMVKRRCKYEPVSKIIGKRQFWGRDFFIDAHVLDPRPETETLIASALERGPVERLLDLGTGSGILAITLLAEWPMAHGIACDISQDALNICRKNAKKHAISDRLTILQSDWFNNIDQTFDLIISNPPYIRQDEMEQLSADVRLFDPHIALTPGNDGLDSYRIIIANAPKYLRPNGVILFEIGPDQGADLINLLEIAKFKNIDILPDMDGRDRVVRANI